MRSAPGPWVQAWRVQPNPLGKHSCGLGLVWRKRVLRTLRGILWGLGLSLGRMQGSTFRVWRG